ncbi:MAG: putative DNA-binding WGR domain protein [Candidatus Marinamargulisbacteria bacterium]|jgi:predicted DNA-binding WGR domain protein
MTQLNLFGKEARLTSIDKARNRCRYYYIDLYSPDGETFTMTKRWGRLKQKRSGDYVEKYSRGSETSTYKCGQLATQKFNIVFNQKVKRGYK